MRHLYMLVEPLCESARALGHSGPTLRWWLSLTASDQGAWVAGMGAFAAAVAAAGIAIWQASADRRRRKAFAKAMAPALLGDLNAMLALMHELRGIIGGIHVVRISNANDVEGITRLVKTICLPSFDRFVAHLPNLGNDVAPQVIDTYGMLTRTAALLKEYTSYKTENARAQIVVATLKSGIDNLSGSIKKSIDMLSRISQADVSLNNP